KIRFYIRPVVARVEAEETDIAVSALIRPDKKQRMDEALVKALTASAVYDAAFAAWAFLHSFCEQEFHGRCPDDPSCVTRAFSAQQQAGHCEFLVRYPWPDHRYRELDWPAGTTGWTVAGKRTEDARTR